MGEITIYITVLVIVLIVSFLVAKYTVPDIATQNEELVYMKNKITTCSENNKWYYKTWVIILFIIFIFPVGLLLMWKSKKWSSKTNIAISCLIVVLLIIGVYSISLPPTKEELATIERVNDYEKLLMENYSFVIDLENVNNNSTTFSITVSDDWYLLKEEEKQFFAEQTLGDLKTISNEGIASISIWDSKAVEVAKGGLKGAKIIK